jgi:hypothetical protein
MESLIVKEKMKNAKVTCILTNIITKAIIQTPILLQLIRRRWEEVEQLFSFSFYTKKINKNCSG